MTARPALIRQSDVTRILKGAKAAGINLGIVLTAGEVRFVPVDTMEPEKKLSTLDEWKAKNRARQERAAARAAALLQEHENGAAPTSPQRPQRKRRNWGASS